MIKSGFGPFLFKIELIEIDLNAVFQMPYFDFLDYDGCLLVVRNGDNVLVRNKSYTLKDDNAMDGDKVIFLIDFRNGWITKGPDYTDIFV